MSEILLRSKPLLTSAKHEHAFCSNSHLSQWKDTLQKWETEALERWENSFLQRHEIGLLHDYEKSSFVYIHEDRHFLHFSRTPLHHDDTTERVVLYWRLALFSEEPLHSGSFYTTPQYFSGHTYIVNSHLSRVPTMVFPELVCDMNEAVTNYGKRFMYWLRQMPIAVMDRIIIKFTKLWVVVFDPCMKTGATANAFQLEGEHGDLTGCDDDSRRIRNIKPSILKFFVLKVLNEDSEIEKS